MFNKKIITVAVSAVLVLALAGVGIYGVVTSGNSDADVTTAATQNNETTTVSETETTTETTTAAPALSELIIGKWTDSANMSGYEFFTDGTVQMTYVNLTVPVINMPINGTAKGVYTLNGDTLITKFSIYSATIEKTYTVSIENNTLSMYDTEERETATYARTTSTSIETTTEATTAVSGADTTTAQQDSSVGTDVTDIAGSWINSDGSVKYTFNKDGTAKITLKKVVVSALGSEPVSGTYSGIYMTEDSNITLQYTVDSEKVTEGYSYSISKNSLSLDCDGDITLFVREGTRLAPAEETDLLGIWRDGANMSGYEFKEGGIVDVTYVNFTVPVINMPINGTYTGSYTISDNTITLNYSIYGNSITDTFTFSISDNVLTFVDDEGDTSTYIKQ